MLPSCRDYKRRFEGNEGSNTGGMGVICPVPNYGDDYSDNTSPENILSSLNNIGNFSYTKIDITLLKGGALNLPASSKEIEINWNENVDGAISDN